MPERTARDRRRLQHLTPAGKNPKKPLDTPAALWSNHHMSNTINHPNGTASTRNGKKVYDLAVVVARPTADIINGIHLSLSVIADYVAKGLRTEDEYHARCDQAAAEIAALQAAGDTDYSVATWTNSPETARKEADRWQRFYTAGTVTVETVAH